jgi:hypothetical protein
MKAENIRSESRDCRAAAATITSLKLLGTALANRRVDRSQAMATSKTAVVKPIEQHIEDAIRRRTGRRVQGLEVRTSGQAVLIRGCAPSYYVEQLALRGVWDVLGRNNAIEVLLELQVPISGSFQR